jgi:prepilin-type N-terminal cleavage/methylation domain-containing protein
MKKGFTLIELLVVIAIIGILSGIVLTSLNTARNKANDAAVKSDLEGMRPSAEIWYDDHSNIYTGFCADTSATKASDAASLVGSGNTTSDVCNESATAWAAAAPLKTAGAWCVDSTGASRLIATIIVQGGVTACPAS